MNFVRDAVIEEAIQVPADELNWRHTVDLVVVGLPEGTKERFPGFGRFGPDGFRDFYFPEVRTPKLVLTEDHRTAGIGIHDTAIKSTTARHSVCMPPKVTELGPVEILFHKIEDETVYR